MPVAKVYVSRKASGEMLAPGADLVFAPDETTENLVINVCPEVAFQEILGFGAAFTETSAYNWSQMGTANRAAILTALFDPKQGLGLNFCRTQIHSSDFGLAEYTYVDDGDAGLATFTIDHDRAWMIPFIQGAQAAAGGELLLFASPWSPPAWMKDNGTMTGGGKLLEEYADTWAAYMARYLTEYGKAGIEFFGMSVQNEPLATQTWESCRYTAGEEGRFVRDHLHPALVRAGFGDVRILIWDHNKERVYDRPRDTFAVPGVQDLVWGIGFHWYSGDHFGALAMAHAAFPDKPLVLTECSVGSGRRETRSGPHSSWDGIVLHTHEMIGDFANHATAIVDWNMIVDEQGGPYHNRDAGCKAMVVVDPATDTVSLEPLYHGMAHFSRYVRRGAVRIGTSSFAPELEVVGFRNPDGSVVVVVLNGSDQAYSTHLRLDGTTAPLAVSAQSLTTVVIGA